MLWLKVAAGDEDAYAQSSSSRCALVSIIIVNFVASSYDTDKGAELCISMTALP
jgi:hypothetical protein